MPGSRSVVITAIAALVTCAAAAWSHVPATLVHFLGAVVVVATVVLARFAVTARRHLQLDAALRRSSVPAVVADTPVRLTPVDDSAFVSGLWRPVIYCGRGLSDTLKVDELRAVMLHERAHQRSHDPLRLLLLETVAPVARLHRCGRAWLERAAAAREIAADRSALEHGASRGALASALLRVAPVPGVGVPGFASAVELRMRALLSIEQPAPARRSRWPWAAVGGAIAVGVCLSVRPLIEAICGW